MSKMKIVPDGSGYIGYILKNDEVVFQTSHCKDTFSCAKELAKYTRETQPSAVPIVRSNHAIPTPTVRPPTPSSSQGPTKRCCGRG